MNHLRQSFAVFNPNNVDENTLPVIYGFNNGGSPGWYTGCLLSEDGTFLGSHLCSSEGFMYYDLGILKGHREDDRHETFKAHYPNGYRMDFVSMNDVKTHEGLMEAYRLNQEMK